SPTACSTGICRRAHSVRRRPSAASPRSRTSACIVVSSRSFARRTSKSLPSGGACPPPSSLALFGDKPPRYGLPLPLGAGYARSGRRGEGVPSATLELETFEPGDARQEPARLGVLPGEPVLAARRGAADAFLLGRGNRRGALGERPEQRDRAGLE